MKEEDEKFLQELKTRIKYKHLLQVLANAMLEDKDNMMIFVETDDRQYELEDVKFEQFLDKNDNVCTVITIKV